MENGLPASRQTQLLFGGVALGAAMLAGFVVVKTSLLASAGFGGALALFLAVGASLLLGAHFFWRRTHKGTARLALIVGIVGLSALLVSDLSAHFNHAEAEDVRTSDSVLAPGERESRVEAATDRAENAALVGLLGLLPALGALFALALAVGDRRQLIPLVPSAALKNAQPALPPGVAPPLPLTLLWVCLFCGAFALFSATGLSLWQIFRA